MKNLVITLMVTLSLSFSGNIFGQSTTESPKDTDTLIYTWVEDQATYPGGFEELSKFIKEHIVYPKLALDQGIEGIVYIKCVIEKDGNVSNINIVKGLIPELNAEAIRVIKLMPKWNPGLQRQQPKRTYFNIPVKFVLPEDSVKIVKNQSKKEMEITNFDIDEEESNKEDEIFVFVEVQAEFPGGEEARLKFLQQNIIYPEIAKEQNEQGTVYVKFVIEKDGSITNVTIMRGVSPSIDAEAIRVIQMMPKWKPSTQRGKPVRVWFNLPIKFTLSNGKKNTEKR